MEIVYGIGLIIAAFVVWNIIQVLIGLFLVRKIRFYCDEDEYLTQATVELMLYNPELFKSCIATGGKDHAIRTFVENARGYSKSLIL